MRPVEQGADAEERDLKYLNRALDRANGNTNRPKKEREALIMHLTGSIEILTNEKMKRSRSGIRKAG